SSAQLMSKTQDIVFVQRSLFVLFIAMAARRYGVNQTTNRDICPMNFNKICYILCVWLFSSHYMCDFAMWISCG
ncbi:MAG: hypothetical protein Q7I91_10220, partial [Moraxellaceae bacterium]|nr:hypothetical protein [Moraxellaceae bacterium]